MTFYTKISINNIKYIFLSCLLIMTSSNVFAVHTNNCPVLVVRPNGCSFIAGASLETVPYASPACDEHDRCYSRIGETKSHCDSVLISEMKRLCHVRFGKIPFIGHAFPLWVSCEGMVALNASALRDNVLIKEAWRDDQARALAHGKAVAANNCDVADTNGVIDLTTAQSNVYGGSDSGILETFAKDARVAPAGIANILTHYRDNGNGKAARMTSSGDRNWQSEVLRDLSMGLNIWNGNYSNPPAVLSIQQQIAQMCEAFYGPPSASNTAYQSCLLI